MTHPRIYTEPEQLDAQSDLQTVLSAWHGATLRLEQTHETLRQEVRRLTDELEAKNRELARKNRLADLGQMASHVAHEVRNSLVPVTLYLSLLRRRLSEDPMNRDLLDKLAVGFTALDATVNDLLHFTGEREPQSRPMDVRTLVDDVLQSLAPQFDAQGIDVTVDVPLGQRLWADHDMLRRCVLNLTLNALDAMPDGGQLVVTSVAGPRGFELEIADSGPGLSDEARRRMFEPFFTTKSSGTGLGLAIVNRIAEAHGGEILACNCPEGGAAFTLRIPTATHVLEAAA
jgi:signal transduction histidine kinase